MKKIQTKLTELRAKTDKQLRADLANLSADLHKVGMGISLQKEKNTSQVNKIKKNIARINTILQEKYYEQ
ncbi:MAG: 50S ribosomal protein L29 [Patescibacteria group bacterium]|jgi:ribosomal protein L29